MISSPYRQFCRASSFSSETSFEWLVYLIWETTASFHTPYNLPSARHYPLPFNFHPHYSRINHAVCLLWQVKMEKMLISLPDDLRSERKCCRFPLESQCIALVGSILFSIHCTIAIHHLHHSRRVHIALFSGWFVAWLHFVLQ